MLFRSGERDVTWLACDGNPLSGSRWDEPALRCFGMQLGRETATEPGLLILINGGESDCDFVLPRAPSGEWRLQLDTAAPDTAVGMPCHGPIRMPAHALLVLDSTAASA